LHRRLRFFTKSTRKGTFSINLNVRRSISQSFTDLDWVRSLLRQRFQPFESECLFLSQLGCGPRAGPLARPRDKRCQHIDCESIDHHAD
jgi:hypothetical protein